MNQLRAKLAHTAIIRTWLGLKCRNRDEYPAFAIGTCLFLWHLMIHGSESKNIFSLKLPAEIFTRSDLVNVQLPWSRNDRGSEEKKAYMVQARVYDALQVCGTVPNSHSSCPYIAPHLCGSSLFPSSDCTAFVSFRNDVRSYTTYSRKLQETC